MVPFNKKKVEVLAWPPCSLDLNPIENVWGLLVRKVYSGGRQFYSIQDLKKGILNAWKEIKIEELNNLVCSMFMI